MSTPWTQLCLSDVAEIIGRGIAPKYSESGDMVVINQKCVRGGRIDDSLARRHDSAEKAVSESKRVRAGDVLVNSTGVGTLGRTAPVRAVTAPTTVDSHITIVRPIPGTDAAWLGYALAYNEPAIESMAEGSTGQTELSRTRVSRLALSVPGLQEQQAIGRLLQALDKKLEAGIRARALLRAVGQACFDSVIARGSRTRRLGELAVSISRGVTPEYADGDPGAPFVLSQKCIRNGTVSTVPARRMAYRNVKPAKRVGDGDILVNSTGVGTLGRVGRWHCGEIFADGHVSIVKVDQGEAEPTVAAYALLGREADIEALATGSTGQTELSVKSLADLDITLPSPSQSAALEPVLFAIEDRLDGLSREAAVLEGIRSLLIPELLSGRIRVHDAERTVREAIA